MKLLYSLSLLLLFSCHSKEESGPAKSLKQNAISIKDLSTLGNKLYKEILNFDVIMVGEMHGTREPSEFVYGLCNLITAKEESVFLGLEIPSTQMKSYSDKMSKEQLMELGFFKGENSSGMNGEAWLDLISKCNKNEKINIRFIDNQNFSTRDSSMYIDLCEIRKQHPKTKIVTLTGNIHNWLKPYDNQERLGGYLIKDTINFIPEKIMSINHMFTEGTMLNNMGNGLDLTTIEAKDNVFNTTISSKMYFCETILEDHNQYTHFFYTEKVTHSKVIGTK